MKFFSYLFKDLIPYLFDALISIPGNIIGLFFKKKRSKPVLYNVRKVKLGIRWKLLMLFTITIALIVSILSWMMFSQQKEAVRDEKEQKAVVLVQLLKDFAVDVLDNGSILSAEERNKAYEFIYDQITKYKKLNPNISSIVLVDVNKQIKAHTSKKFLDKYLNREDIIAVLAQEHKNKATFHEFSTNNRNYLTVSYPIWVEGGNISNIISDYDKYFVKYSKYSKGARVKLCKKLAEKYDLDYDPPDSRDYRKLVKERKKNNIYVVEKYNDLDFLFLEIIRDEIKLRKKAWYIPKDKRSLVNNKWLTEEKIAMHNDGKDRALIDENIAFLVDQLRSFERLGGLVIMFNIDRIKEDLNANIKKVRDLVGTMILIGMIITIIVVQMIVVNIKKLEKAAVKLGRGDLEAHADVKANDELGRLSDVFNFMVRDIKEKFHLEKYVSTSTKDMIKKHHKAKKGNTGRVTLPFMFSDVRGFTSYTETHDPAEVVKNLNDYFELQARVIKKHKGDIDSFIGDAIMAHFDGKNMVDDAIAACMEIIKQVKVYNQKRRQKKQDAFEIGIGLNMGEVVVGNLGSKNRMDFTAIGDAVNLSARLSGLAGPGEILISRDMLDEANKTYKITRTRNLPIKGKSSKVAICTLKI